MRRARRAILPALGAGLAAPLVPAAFAHQAAAQEVPASPPAPVQQLASVRQLAAASATAAEPPAAHQPAAHDHHTARSYRLYAVRPGDTMSGIARNRCGNPADWTGIYAASRALRTVGTDPDLIYPGQILALSCTFVPSSLRHEASVVVARHYAVTGPARHDPWDGQHHACGDGDRDGYDMPCSMLGHGSSGGTAIVRYSSGRSSASYQAAGSVYHGSGAMQQCIISRESGGNSQVMNSSGHYGLYQFSAQTWAANGGNPGDFGHASVAEQNQVYQNTVNASGYSAWAPYDGC